MTAVDTRALPLSRLWASPSFVFVIDAEIGENLVDMTNEGIPQRHSEPEVEVHGEKEILIKVVTVTPSHLF